MELPEISAGTGLLFAVILGVCGVLIGTHVHLVYQIVIVVVVVLVLNSHPVKHLEIGALCYFLMGAGLIVGMVAGDINYFLQKHVTIDLPSFTNPFKVK